MDGDWPRAQRHDEMGTIDEEDEEVGRRVISSLNALRSRQQRARQQDATSGGWRRGEERRGKRTTASGRGGGGNNGAGQGREVIRDERRHVASCCVRDSIVMLT